MMVQTARDRLSIPPPYGTRANICESVIGLLLADVNSSTPNLRIGPHLQELSHLLQAGPADEASPHSSNRLLTPSLDRGTPPCLHTAWLTETHLVHITIVVPSSPPQTFSEAQQNFPDLQSWRVFLRQPREHRPGVP